MSLLTFQVRKNCIEVQLRDEYTYVVYKEFLYNKEF